MVEEEPPADNGNIANLYLRIVFPRFLNTRWKRRTRIFFPSLERLQKLHRHPSTLEPDSLHSRSSEFSRLVSELCFDGSWKYTSLGRNRQSNQLLVELFRIRKPLALQLLDIGASDGSTTLEMINAISSSLGISVSATMIDKYLTLVCRRKGFVKEYSTSDGKAVFVRLGPFGIVLEKIHENAFKKFLFRYFLSDFFYRKFVCGYLRWSSLRKRLVHIEKISLINPIVESDNSVCAIEKDAFSRHAEWIARFDVVRAANVLNPGRFSIDEMKEAVVIFSDYIKDGGFLVMSRNLPDCLDSKENASIWEKKDGKLALRTECGGGF